MQVRPPDVSDDAVSTLVAERWGLPVSGSAYLAWGFGSHHWGVELAGGGRRFVTLDTVGPGLAAAMSTARALADSGLAEVVAPTPAADGGLLQPLHERYAVAVFPWLRAAERVTGSERARCLDLLGRLRAATPSVLGVVGTDDLAVEGRAALDSALDDLGSRWEGGPFAETAQALVASVATRLRELLIEHDAVATSLEHGRATWVVTHGEPKPGNLLKEGDDLRLVDWDTVLLAPPGRDLWMVDPAADPHSGWWARRWLLTDVATYVGDFRSPHVDDADTRIGWAALEESLTALGDGRVPWPDVGW